MLGLGSRLGVELGLGLGLGLGSRLRVGLGLGVGVKVKGRVRFRVRELCAPPIGCCCSGSSRCGATYPTAHLARGIGVRGVRGRQG